MAEQTNLPSIPPPNENNLVAFARAVKEALEVRLGRRGQGLDAMVTFRDLEKVQMVQSDGRGGVAGLKPPAVVGTVGGSYNPAADTTPPTAPQNVKASGAVRNVIIEWDGPPSTYRNHAYAEIWRSSANNLNDAAQIGQSGSTMYVDAVGEGQTRYYWVRFVSQANVTGPWHAAGDAGAQAVTALDVAYALGLLAGQIRETHLYQTLGARIDLIDGAGPGSVDARVAGVQAQINSINGELAAISQTPVYDAAETYAAGVLVTYNGGLYRALQATTGNLPTNAAYWEKVGDYASLGEAVAAHALQLTDHETRVTSAEGAITAEAEARTLLETQVGANTAAIQAEAQTRATETGALSTQITTVVANYQAADAATLTSAQGYADTAAAGAAGTALTTAQAAVQAEAAARASADGALAESITTVQTTVGANTAAIQTQATSINGLSAQYTIKVQAGGISGGLGLAAESPDGTDGVIDFAIRANRFHIAPPDGMGDVKTALFTHYATPTTINGVEIPAGTYMDAAFMRTFVAQKGQIGELAVDDAAIDNLSAAKLTAGDGTIGGRLKSSNYVAGETGWIVRPDGTAEFAGATVRGTIYADTGWFKGQIIGGNATTYASGAGMWTGDDDDIWKFRLGSDGTYLRWDGSSLTLRGTLTIEDGAGNVLLSAGEGVPWGRISGAGRPEDGATVGMLATEQSTGYTSENGWTISKDGTFSSNGGGNQLLIGLNSARINFNKPNDGGTSFAVDEQGNALFSGQLMAATGTFAGTLQAGVLDPSAFAGIVYTYSGPGSHTPVVPAKPAGWATMNMRVTLVGAGGGGGGCANKIGGGTYGDAGDTSWSRSFAGGGGGAGQLTTFVIANVTPGTTYALTVGSGGAGGAGSSAYTLPGSGANGGATSIAGIGSASGGTGGSGAPWASGSSTWNNSNGPGGSLGGQNGLGDYDSGFLAGADNGKGGAGGSSAFGAGGTGGYGAAGSHGGTGAGGGGGGGAMSGFNGGAGGNGYAIVEFFDKDSVITNTRYSNLIAWLDTIGHGAVPSNAR